MPFVKNCIIWVAAKTSTAGNLDVLQMCYIIYQYKVLYFEIDYQVKPTVPGNYNIIGLNQRLALSYIVNCHCMGCGAIEL